MTAKFYAENFQRVQAHLFESTQVQRQVIDNCMDSILETAQLIIKTFKSGNKLLICGNGGSAADSQHFAGEFVSLLDKNYIRPALPAIALTTDTSIITAYSNDFGFDGVFARQVQALGKPNDVLIVFSTSGNSKNVILAVNAAKKITMKTIAFTGNAGKLKGLVDIAIKVPSDNTQFIQETHLSIEHAICELVDLNLFPKFGKKEKDL